jgi:catechol 2,3-dioxygenase-like lactoylglutathione lyase family enzyme
VRAAAERVIVVRQSGQTMIVGIDHVQLAMPPGREDDARGFYERLLGIPEVPKPPGLAKRGGAWFEDGQVKIHLGVESEFKAARKAHPGLLVDNLWALVVRLHDAGIVVAHDEPLAGYDRVYVDDPFGNRLELLERMR